MSGHQRRRSSWLNEHRHRGATSSARRRRPRRPTWSTCRPAPRRPRSRPPPPRRADQRDVGHAQPARRHRQQRRRLHTGARPRELRTGRTRPRSRPTVTRQQDRPGRLADHRRSPSTATGRYARRTPGPPPACRTASPSRRNGAVSGTPTATGTYDVDRDGHRLGTPRRRPTTSTFTFTIDAARPPGADRRDPGHRRHPPSTARTSRPGVVTASYPTGGLNGFYIQTRGADTADASDAIFVYGGTSGFATYPAVGDSVEVDGQGERVLRRDPDRRHQGRRHRDRRARHRDPQDPVPGTDCALPGTACLSRRRPRRGP